MLRTITALSLAASLVAVSGAANATEKPSSLVFTGSLVATQDGTQASDVTITLRKDGTTEGKAPCNQYFGNTKRTNDLWATTGIQTTLMLCDEATMKAEENFLSVIAGPVYYTLADDTLTLVGIDGKTTTFTSAIPTFVGTVDVKKTSNPAFKGLKSDVSINLSHNGLVGFDAGCNAIWGEVESVEGRSLRMSGLRSTFMACDRKTMLAEKALKDAFNGLVPFQVQGDTLTVLPYTNDAIVFTATTR